MAKKVINSSKKEAILQLVNFICDSSVTEIAELADGKILLKTIQDKFPQFEYDSPHNDQVEDVESEIMDVDGNSENANKCTEFRFKCLQKFIDDCYGIKSCDIISFVDCLKKEDYEILKVTIFVLSECVKHLLQINQEHLKTLYHLDMKYQVELEDCFKTLISERYIITKGIVEKLLSKSAVKSSPYLTPVRQSARCKQRKSSLSPKEEVFSSSPLKVYFESPVFKKEDILMKDREIENLQKVLNEGDEQSSELLHRLSEFEKQIKEKDIQIKKLQKQIAQMNTEVNHLQNSCQSASCKAEKKELEKKLKIEETAASLHLENYNRLQEQNSHYESEILRLENKLDEERGKVNKSPLISINEENERLKKRLEDLKKKLYGYKLQLSQKVITELKAKKSSGNLNQTYENVWAELDKVRKEHEENLAFAIEEDNKRLFYKNKELLKENKELLEKIRILQGNKSSEMFTSVDKSYLPVRECTIAEMEKGRDFEQSNVEDCNLSDEPSYTVLNNSNDIINSEQSVFLPNSEICPENPPEAVLWRNYDDSNHEIENAGDINFSEKLHLDANSNLEIKYTESDTSLREENEYIFENLNFNGFLSKLKKLTKNGSFQKVQRVLEKNIKMKRANKSNSLDIQELLQIITECMSIVVSVNGSSNVQDKCTSTDVVFQDKSCLTEKPQNIQGKINSVCETCEIELKKNIKIIEQLKKEKAKLEREYENLTLVDEHREKEFTAVLVNYDKEKSEFDDCKRKYEHLKNIHLECVKEQKKIIQRNEFIGNMCVDESKKCRRLEKHNEQLIGQNKLLKHNLQIKEHKLKGLKEDLQMKESTLKEFIENFRAKETELKALKEYIRANKYKLKEIEHLQVKESTLNEREKRLKTGMCPSNLDSEESFVQKPNSLTVTVSYPSTSQDAANESTLSGIYQKNQSQYVLDQSQYPNTDEDDFVYFNSLEAIKNSHGDSRVEELKRRNSLYPMHLQSSYPTEIELNSSYAGMYIKNEENCKEENCTKKRKLDHLIPEEPSTSSRWSCKSSDNYNDSSQKLSSSSVASKILKKYKTSTPKRIAKIVKRVCNSQNSLSMKR